MNLPKRWQVAPVIGQDFLEKFPEINPITLQLLYNRGLTEQQEIDEFLSPDYSQNILDPFLFNDMEKAVKRILTAIEKKEKITIYGDYDADGVTSSTLVMKILEALGAVVDVYIPYRETEGYGLNKEAANEQIKKGTNLLITVDCGISNVEEVDILTRGGIDVIITDHHHEPLFIPKAFAIINQHLKSEKYPFKDLVGCGVAFKLAQGLLARHQNYQVNQLPAGCERLLLDLVAIGTIADLQPILGENRVLVKTGLDVLHDLADSKYKDRNYGLRELCREVKIDLKSIDERTIGWQIAPRLNAAGRMNHASTAFELLVTKDQTEAKELATQLNQTNRDRQQLTDKIFNEAQNILGEVIDQKLLSVVGNNWLTGVVGLVSGRLTDRYHRPSLVISRYNGEIIGSGRSIPEFNIIEAAQQCSEYLSRFGGHAQACGFTVKNEPSLAKFIDKMTSLAETELKDKDISPILPIEAEVSLENIDWAIFEELKKFEPYGEGNPKPIFLARDLTVSDRQTVGNDGKHLRLMVKHNSDAVRKTIGFCFGEWCARIKKGDKVDMVFEVDVNEWNGNQELQLKIVDLALSK
ncbi:MAG: single-stranded-DNA-specific exonuclease RecJ [Candidatus Buchananbacteria bacterium]